MFDVFYIGPKPGLFLHEQECDSIDHAVKISRTRYCWIVNYLSDYTGFDFLWEPPPWQAHQQHAWASQWQKDSGTYLIPRSGHSDTNYHTFPIIKRLPTHDSWKIPAGIDLDDFDFSWHPDPTEPAMIYQFGTQHQPTNGPRYCVPGATTVKYISTPRAHKTAQDPYWIVPENMNRDAFDWTWHPDDRELPYRYQFPTQWNRAGGPEYAAPGGQDIKFVSVQVARMLPTDRNWIIPPGIDINSFDFSWTPDPTEPPYIYEFGTQWQKTGGPCYVVPGATERKYITQPRAVRTVQDPYWEIPEGADVETFDWTWHPDSTEQPYIYQFGTQHQRTGGPRYRAPGATDVKYVDQIRIRTQRVATAIVEIDHMDGNAGKIPDTTKTSRYFDNYLDTLRRIAKNIDREHEFIWICSSVCDYTDFDFSWHPEQWQATMLHVFASDGEKFGDTFFMHVPTFQYRSENTKLLEWYDVNFVESVSVPRRPMPVIQHKQDSQVDVVKETSWLGPLALFTSQAVDTVPVTVPLWREKTKTIVPLDEGGATVIVPRVAIPYIKTQLYDYPYVDKTHRNLKNYPLDIVFISNGEHGADHHWGILQSNVINGETGLNRICRVDGINGRVAAYQAAAQASQTDWFFAVFAKLQINENFDWSWQPDRLQQAKHYIFHAYNPVNHLTYGHQAVIAYNRRLVLENAGPGLDFTLDQAHEVVPIISGTAYYDNDPWTCWRTAFREALKLRHSLPDVENEYRLDQWLSVGEGVNGHWSTQGALDAVSYYDSVAGEFGELKKSYEWQWLASYAMMLHPGLFTESKT